MSGFQAEAVLFDKDGVLLDTMAMIRSTWREWAAGRGLDPDEVLASIHMTAFELLERFAPSAEPSVEIRKIAAWQATLEPEIAAFAGAAELLDSLPPGAWAIVTSARREVSVRHLRTAGLPVPEVLVCAEDTPRGKPDPSGFLLAAARLHASPARCVVVEDAPAGVRAGKQAGMFVIAVTTSHTAAELVAADAVVPSLRALEMRARPASAAAHGGVQVSWRKAL